MGIRSWAAAQGLHRRAVDERLRGNDSGESRCIQESGAELHLFTQLPHCTKLLSMLKVCLLDAAPRVRISN